MTKRKPPNIGTFQVNIVGIPGNATWISHVKRSSYMNFTGHIPEMGRCNPMCRVLGLSTNYDRNYQQKHISMYHVMSCEQSRKPELHGKDIHKFAKVTSLTSVVLPWFFLRWLMSLQVSEQSGSQSASDFTQGGFPEIGLAICSPKEIQVVH